MTSPAETPTQPTTPSPAGWRMWVRSILSLIALIVIMDLIFFVIAGRLDWVGAWLFTIMYVVFLLIFLVWGMLKDPDLLKERSRVAENVKPWDKVIMTLYTIALVAELATAALDAGRFRWSNPPFILQIIGALGLFPVGALILWTVTTNSYLARWARIQDDRGQRVVTSGPYHYVRHPMYAGIILFFVCLALTLGSLWALIPAGLIGVLFVIRTALEDRMLMTELPGYPDYARQVRYRLLPGVW